MATGRMLKKNISKSEKFAALESDRARMLYLLILPHLDVAGRFEASPKLIKGLVAPLLNISLNAIQTCLKDMHRTGLIILYQINNSQLLEYTKFADFQNLRNDREAQSEMPPPPAQLPENSRSSPVELPLKLSKVKLSKVKLSKVKLSKVKLNTPHKKQKNFVPPSFDEVKKYIEENPELSNVDAETFFKGFNDSSWIDTRGNPVKNWKLKLRTWSSYGRARTNQDQTAGQRPKISEQDYSSGGSIPVCET